MISAQSHHQLLSGSNLLLWVVCLSILCSCKPGKKVINNSSTQNNNEPVISKVDTIVWKEDTMAPPPIKSDEVASKVETIEDVDPSKVPDSEKKSEYNIAVLFPFYSDSYSTDEERTKMKSQRAIQLYGGMQLAMEKLEVENIGLHFNVLDTKGKTDITNGLLQQPDIYSSDLIFGPFRSDNLKLSSKMAMELRCPVISPMNPSDKITTENPYFVQMKPSLSAHIQAITDHVMAQNYVPVQVVIVARNKSGEKQRIQMFQEALAQNQKIEDGPKFREYLVSDYSNEFENMDFQNFIIEGAKTVFIVPSWSSESFINNVLRKIRLVKLENEVVVYGMPQWKDFQRVSFDDYDALKVHISSDNHLNMDQQNIQNFAKSYFYKFGETPNEDAYFGYDMTLHMVRSLIKYGTQFQSQLDRTPYTGLASDFRFETIYNLEQNDLETAPIKLIENRHVDILKFEGFQFKLAK